MEAKTGFVGEGHTIYQYYELFTDTKTYFTNLKTDPVAHIPEENKSISLYLEHH